MSYMLEQPKAYHSFLGENVEDEAMEEPKAEMVNQQERRDAAIWLAGLIQGEGSVTMCWGYGGHGSPVANARVVIYNSDKDVIDAIQHRCDVLSAGQLCYESKRKEGSGWNIKPLYVVMVRGFKRLARFLPEVTPFLVGEKKKRAEMVMQICNSRSPLPKGARYSPQDINLVNMFIDTFAGKGWQRHRESSTANTLNVDGNKSMMIESDPLAKASGGESVSKYPAPISA